MKISSVESYLLSFHLPEPLRLVSFGGEITVVKRDAMLIRISTADGLTGYAPGEPSEQAKHIIDRLIGPFLVGRTLADPDALRILFQQGPGTGAEVSRIYSAVEIALYDLMGKAHRLPVSEFIGGRVRDRIRLYGSVDMRRTHEEYAREALRLRELGFGAAKIRLGAGPEHDLEAVRRTREAVGTDFELIVDAQNWWQMGDRSYSTDTVDKSARDMAAYRVLWIEEPLPPGDHAAYLRLKTLDLAPLAAGEHEPGELGFLDLIESGAVDYVQMEIVSQGGYATARRLFPDIARAGLRFAFHGWGTTLEVAAAAQLGVCWPESVVRWLEYPCYLTPGHGFLHPFPIASEMLKQPLAIEQGELVVPDDPGLGVDVDESVIWRYPWIPGPWSFFRIDSPPQTQAFTANRMETWA